MTTQTDQRARWPSEGVRGLIHSMHERLGPGPQGRAIIATAAAILYDQTHEVAPFTERADYDEAMTAALRTPTADAVSDVDHAANAMLYDGVRFGAVLGYELAGQYPPKGSDPHIWTATETWFSKAAALARSWVAADWPDKRQRFRDSDARTIPPLWAARGQVDPRALDEVVGLAIDLIGRCFGPYEARANELQERVLKLLPEDLSSEYDIAYGGMMCERDARAALIGWALHATAPVIPLDEDAEIDASAWVERALRFAGFLADPAPATPAVDQLAAWLAERVPGVSVDDVPAAVLERLRAVA